MSRGLRLVAAGGSEDAVNASINTTPLVDVMLVLLIIFLITIPVVTKTVPLELPKQSNVARQTKPENIELSVDRDGAVYWNAQRLAGQAELFERLKAVAVQAPQPVVQIRGDGRGRYEPVGRLLLACQRAAISKISFITEPPAKG
ncbi:biopolymer transporter ExbD [Pelomonas sp. KK5]|uniref:ExbD/TolR family protein n=1 Tax=Pelomonas sp. KK5 TaxID=1855730 RepID=UPI00097CBDEB|nr:biopolymer transporter ExbD [Pelomonas sp. KK5]